MAVSGRNPLLGFLLIEAILLAHHLRNRKCVQCEFHLKEALRHAGPATIEEVGFEARTVFWINSLIFPSRADAANRGTSPVA
jgi:hypothetical protein